MKKIYTLLLSLAVGSTLSLTAQQLPNAGFETGWAKTTPYTGGSSKQTDGLSPQNWVIAHVAGFKLGLIWMGTTTVGGQTTGYNSTYAAYLENSPNPVATNQIVPGYITLGTTWNTASSTGDNKDGGSFGGYTFTHRPDALAFQYQRGQASGSSEQATVVAYMWKGTATQTNVPVSIGSSPTKVTMTDRDRNILGMSYSYGDEPQYSSDYERIATINYAINGAASNWTSMEIPFNYEGTSSSPSKINVIFAASNYFSTSPEKGNTLTIDDVKLLYYSRLNSININGVAVNGFDSKTYNYTIDSEMPEATAFSFTTLGNSGSASATLDLNTEDAIATITVTNSNAGGTDYDGASSHTYTLQFNKADNPGEGDITTEPEGAKYNGTLNIKLDVIGLDVTQNDNVYIKDNGNGTCLFTLPNFTLTLPGSDPANFGDIVVDNVEMTTNADGSITYEGSVQGLSLAGGEVVADVDLSGTEVDGVLEMNIPVVWEGLTIDVTFNGQKEESGSETPDTEIEYCQPTGVDGRYNSENQTTFAGRNVTNIVVSDDTNSITIEGSSSSTTRAIVYDRTTSILNTEAGKTISMNVTGNGTWMNTFVYVDFNKNNFDINDQVYENYTLKNQTTVGNDVSTSFTFTVPATVTPGEYRARYILDWQNTDPCKYGQAKTSTSNNDNGEVVIDFIIKVGDEAGIDGIGIDPANGPIEYYNLQGVRVATENLTPGFYVVRQGNNVAKVLIRK